MWVTNTSNKILKQPPARDNESPIGSLCQHVILECIVAHTDSSVNPKKENLSDSKMMKEKETKPKC